jgi:hypothetical protein
MESSLITHAACDKHDMPVKFTFRKFSYSKTRFYDYPCASEDTPAALTSLIYKAESQPQPYLPRGTLAYRRGWSKHDRYGRNSRHRANSWKTSNSNSPLSV